MKRQVEPSLHDTIDSIRTEEKLINEVLSGVDTLVDLKDIKHGVKYKKSKNQVRKVIHMGQFKLLCSEIEFLTEVLPSRYEHAIVIYAGSAPSHKMHYLSSLFPHVKFVLVDPAEHYVMYGAEGTQYDDTHIQDFLYFVSAAGNKFNLQNRKINLYRNGSAQVISRPNGKTGRIPKDLLDIITTTTYKFYVIEDFFTNETAEIFSHLKDPYYFISDIRSRDDEFEFPTDLDVLWNSALMFNWLSRMKPKKFMLKFRAPYTIDDRSTRALLKDYEKNEYTHAALEECKSKIDFIGDYKKGKFRFIKPEHIWLQAFAGEASSETRLVASNLDIIEFSIQAYEDKLFYYNRIHRSYGFHRDSIVDQKICLDRCGDCALAVYIFREYHKKYVFSVGQLYDTMNSIVIENIRDAINSIGKKKFCTAESLHGTYTTRMKNVDELTYSMTKEYEAKKGSTAINKTFSNKTYTPLIIDGMRYDTVEHFFQASKFLPTKDWSGFPNIASKIRQEVNVVTIGLIVKEEIKNINPRWDEIKDSILHIALFTKFIQNKKFRDELMGTEDEHIKILTEGRADGIDMGKKLEDLRERCRPYIHTCFSCANEK